MDHLCGLVVRVPGYISRGPGSISLRYQISWEVMSLKRGPLSLVSTTEEQLERKSSGFGLESREYGRRDPSFWPQKLVPTSSTSGGNLVAIGLFRTQATELFL
jgi:hypothetical protein